MAQSKIHISHGSTSVTLSVETDAAVAFEKSYPGLFATAQVVAIRVYDSLDTETDTWTSYMLTPHSQVTITVDTSGDFDGSRVQVLAAEMTSFFNANKFVELYRKPSVAISF